MIAGAPKRSVPWQRSSWLDLTAFAALAGIALWLTLRGAGRMAYAWQWERVWPYLWRDVDGEIIWGPLVRGLAVTLQISSLAAVMSLAIGLACALLRLSGSVAGRWLAVAYVELVRNTPLLLQILIFYFIIGRVLDVPRLWCGILTLAFYEGTFAAEIIRGGILAIPRGQWEASRSLGLKPAAAYRLVILPQAIPLMLPPMTGVLVNLVKHSAIVSVIAIFDLATEARTVIADTFMSFEVWLVVAAMYLSVTI
jgi:polar amino acid transport system permease protein